jgi:glycosyltransferase involved in cell wall biosynthesis
MPVDPANVSFVNSLCVTKDAISASLRDHLQWTRESSAFRPMLFCGNLEYQDLPAYSSHNYWDIARHAHFQQSDVAVFHFGVCYDAFNLLWLCPPPMKKVVVFHNITPPHLVSDTAKADIARSFQQLSSLALADLIICDSQTNADVLREHCIRTPCEVLPLALSPSAIGAPPHKPSTLDGVLRLAFVGRFVKSKGPTEALQAMINALEQDPQLRLEFCMIGKLEWSDRAVMEDMRQLMAWIMFRWPERAKIRLLGDASERQKQETLAAADCLLLPTYHEGFCVPILEAMSHGCRVVTYKNSNTPAISGGLGRLVPTGDIAALTQAIMTEASEIASTSWRSDHGEGTYAAYRHAAAKHLEQFSETAVRDHFLRILESQVSRPHARPSTTHTERCAS